MEAAVTLCNTTPRFLKGIDEFNQGFFYVAHETLEQLWLEDHGPGA